MSIIVTLACIAAISMLTTTPEQRAQARRDTKRLEPFCYAALVIILAVFLIR